MILTNRLFQRGEPGRDAKSFYIFCEGVKREFQYFRYFRGIDSRINIEVYPLDPEEDNSPVGLYEIALKSVVRTSENPHPQYEFIAGLDEVWIVIDTDRWGKKINELRQKCRRHQAWSVAQSNPCFKVWLYYHLFSEKPNFPGMGICNNWKNFLNDHAKGGFDSRRHPIFVKRAIDGAEKNYENVDDSPGVGCSEVFKLAKNIYPLIENKINQVLAKIEAVPKNL